MRGDKGVCSGRGKDTPPAPLKKGVFSIPLLRGDKEGCVQGAGKTHPLPLSRGEFLKNLTEPVVQQVSLLKSEK